MSRNYKYSFADQLLIHAQRPDASACAGYDVWTQRMGRYVRRGAKGIALVDNSGDAPRLRYVFDVSDTGARKNSRLFEPWQVNSENTDAVASALEARFGVESRVSLAEQLEVVSAQLADEYWLDNSGDILGIVDGSFLEGYDEFAIGVKFRNAAVVSLTHSLLTRCGFEPENYLTPENFEDVFEWNTPEATSTLGTAVSSINQIVLREIERSIRSYERSQRHPRIKEKMNLDVEVSKLRLLKSSFQSQKYSLEYDLLRYFPCEIAETKARIAALDSDIQTRDAHPASADSFAGIELDGVRYTERVAAGEALLQLLPMVQDMEPVHVGSFRGFDVEISLSEFGKYSLALNGAAEHHVKLGSDALGNILRIENTLAGMDRQLEKARARLEDLERQTENARSELEKPFPQEAELAEKSARLIELNAELDMENSAPPEPVAEENEDERPSLLAKLKEPIPLYEPKQQHQMREACR